MSQAAESVLEFLRARASDRPLAGRELEDFVSALRGRLAQVSTEDAIHGV